MLIGVIATCKRLFLVVFRLYTQPVAGLPAYHGFGYNKSAGEFYAVKLEKIYATVIQWLGRTNQHPAMSTRT